MILENNISTNRNFFWVLKWPPKAIFKQYFRCFGGCPCRCVGGYVCKFQFKFSRPFMVRLPSNFFWDLPRVSILRNEEMAQIRRPEGCPPAPSPKTLKMP